MKSLIFATALLCSGIDAIRTNTLLQQNFDNIFNTGDKDKATSDSVQLEDVDSASSAYVVDQLGNLYVTPDTFSQADSLNLAYAAPTQVVTAPRLLITDSAGKIQTV